MIIIIVTETSRAQPTLVSASSTCEFDDQGYPANFYYF